MDHQQLNPGGGKPVAAAAPPLHKSHADDDDENVKQLDECYAVYFLMQVKILVLLSASLNPSIFELESIALVRVVFCLLYFRIALFEQTGIGKNASQKFKL
ncbi:uncharacterized protein LOC130979474 isoform X1 [Arachis stenosperma]|uniref:uncharacterized protein LOC130979474 isoform X1 n=1 Tax=Arachis stenosperma TaxID=217475 RepID=UPI0025AC7582|nr:uncharacterized protein LOC130979474 isoform X1 [Arachis stenosperma]